MRPGLLIIDTPGNGLPTGFCESLEGLGFTVKVLNWDGQGAGFGDQWLPDAVVVVATGAASDLDTPLLLTSASPITRHAVIGLVAPPEQTPRPATPLPDFALAHGGACNFLAVYTRLCAAFSDRGSLIMQSRLTWPGVEIDTALGSVAFEGHRIRPSRKEFELLTYLAQRPERVFGRRQLLNAVWRGHGDAEERTVDVAVSRLRAALKKAGAGRLVATHRGRGYAFHPPVAPGVRSLRPRYTTAAVPEATGALQ